jgi:hypothetical protein
MVPQALRFRQSKFAHWQNDLSRASIGLSV